MRSIFTSVFASDERPNNETQAWASLLLFLLPKYHTIEKLTAKEW